MTHAETAASEWPQPFKNNYVVFLTFGTGEISMSLIYWPDDESALILVKSDTGLNRLETSETLGQAICKLKAKGGLSDILGSTFKKIVKYFNTCKN